MDVETLYREYKGVLFSVAYRMLGTAADAEDIVQDLFAALPEKLDELRVTSWKSYLVKAVTNRCLNVLQSARKQREVYTGPWLPEPVLSDSAALPEDAALLREDVSYAFLVMLEQLTPAERAVFVLREAFYYDYEEIAEVLDKSEVSCRKLYSRARQKLPQRGMDRTAAKQTSGRLAELFMEAVRTGRFDSLVGVLAEEARLVSDGGGKTRAALVPIVGRDRIVAFFQGIYGKGSLQGDIRQTTANGQKAILLLTEGRLKFIFLFDLDPDGRLEQIFLISNPDKLSRFWSQISEANCLS
ncbi:RNA polymerase sigma-70 factor [Paenibacillus hamazuiensis]|uniref:RNA polymerase sigma-70 factor n=1 Tax=Paenibacillus hamazuiensis TaxID=2936508 RepID=UPI00200F3083|nr:RNA polymerase sigma-70 factor [Paenibacillus hamazuiensis]